MKNQNYNKQRHYELLKRESMNTNSQEDSFELRQYSCMLEAHLDWQNHKSYLKLIKAFLKGNIPDYRFCFAFDERGLLMSDISDILESNLILLSPQEEDKHFAKMVSLIIETCKDFIREAPNHDKNSIIEFENSIKELYFQMQEILKKDYRVNCRTSSNLSELVDQLNWENQDHYIELLEEFLSDSSNFLNVKKKYDSIVEAAKELESNSISLKLSYQAFGFSNYLLILIKFFESYQMNADEISPKLFKLWVHKILLEIKTHYS